MSLEPMVVHCSGCQHEWSPCFLPASVEVVAKSLKCACPSCGSKSIRMGWVPRKTKDGDAIGRLSSGDTGISSRAIWNAMMCRPQERWGGNHPHDPSDFGRCHRLLEVMPSWRPLLAEKVSPLSCEWARLIEAWDELTALYLEELPSGNAPRTYHRMKEVIEGKAVSA